MLDERISKQIKVDATREKGKGNGRIGERGSINCYEKELTEDLWMDMDMIYKMC